MPDKDYVTVRRPADAPFGVLPGDMVADDLRGYDLTLIRSLAAEGLDTPITVRPLRGGRFKVVDGMKRLTAIRFLVRTNAMVYDALRGLMRPARRVFAIVRCRAQPPPGFPGRRPMQPPEG